MDARKATHGARELGTLAGRVIEPALLRRAGLTLSIASNWTEIVGQSLGERTRPVRVRWGRRPGPGEAPAPGTLVIACDGATALRVQHQADQIVERVNAVHGRGAIAAIRIEQRPVRPPARMRKVVEPTAAQREEAAGRSATIEHDRLRTALSRLGARVIAASASTSSSNVMGDTIPAGQTSRIADRTEPDR